MKKENISVKILIVTVLVVTQYILTFFVFDLSSFRLLRWLGWGVWLLSVYFGFAPIFIFRRRGGVARGKSYVQTTRLVDTNLYAIVRHPQYVAGMLFNFALMLLSTQWLVVVLGLVSMVLIYLDIRAADQEGIEKFGDDYQAYMQRVPRANFLLGIFLWLKQRRS
jgi:protein-S-isoprenylcysteine O-methyltransferase Ste14